MTLGECQRLFARRVPRLIDYINDICRAPAFGGQGEQGPYGEAWSAHKQRLAIDLNLFLDGEYLTSTEAHRPFGEYWKSIDPENHVWGGDFDDGNHYSFRYNGIA